MQSSAEYIPHCQYILDNSSHSYALLVAATALTKLITTHWNNFTAPQHVEIRNYMLNYLATKGPQLQDFVSKSLIQLVCRSTKLGWFDDQQHREITQEVTKFLTASSTHRILGLQILNQLVEELNIPLSGRTLTQHRKTAVAFRDSCLLEIFNMSLNVLQQLVQGAVTGISPEENLAMSTQGLNLAVKCLSFDFIGTNPDESADDVGTIQVLWLSYSPLHPFHPFHPFLVRSDSRLRFPPVLNYPTRVYTCSQVPSTWRGVVQDPNTMTVLLTVYRTTEPPRSSSAMQAVILLSSVRRSLFRSEKERTEFLGTLMEAIREILSSDLGLAAQENYHEFCRLLGAHAAPFLPPFLLSPLFCVLLTFLYSTACMDG